MRWIDVFGPPGSWKSTICAPLWGNQEMPCEDRLPPEEWHDFLNEMTRLFHLIKGHPRFEAVIRMNNRSIRKMATVARLREEIEIKAPPAPLLGKKGPYIQTALIQRGTGFGWRMTDMGLDINELRHYFRLMPVSLGVAVTKCPEEIIIERNRERLEDPATRHENRDFMVPLMRPAIELALEVLHERCVPILEVDTTRSVAESQKQLREYADDLVGDSTPHGPSCEVAVLSPPPWWR